MEVIVEKTIAGKKVTIETGKIAKQASGSVLVRSGDTVVMGVVVGGGLREGIDFFPLMCEFREKMFASGKIPGGFLKRESRLGNRETLVSRMIDRPIRPNFPEGYKNEVQITTVVLSYDPDHNPDTLAMIAASAALGISKLPFNTVLGAVRVGCVDGELIACMTAEQEANSTIDLLVSGSKDSIMMVECAADEISEEQALDAIDLAQSTIREIVELQEELIEKAGVKKDVFESPSQSNSFLEKMKSDDVEGLKESFSTPDKASRSEKVGAFKETLKTKYLEGVGEDELAEMKNQFGDAFDELKKVAMRELIFSGVRCDNRGLEDIRPIATEVKLLPRVHGSALFTRGETQSIVTCTLGTSKDALMIDDLGEKRFEPFMLHYNFPKYCVGETGPDRGAGRREIGHGNLAMRALKPVVPSEEDFPYTIRLVSDITESNGSSSMASVCGGSLAMMDAGIPLSAPVAGIAMGLIQDGDREAVISDILGDEDHYGDMDFKVAGTEKGLTALQMDIKIQGLSRETLVKAMTQAKKGRLHILAEMAKTLSTPKEEVSDHAPRITKKKVNSEFIGKIIGPGGANIRQMQMDTQTEITIEDDGTVSIFSKSKESTQKALDILDSLTAKAEVGKAYDGIVKSVKDFGVFIEVLVGTEGLLHVSEVSDDYIKDINEVAKLGDKFRVVVANIDRSGKLKLVREEKYDKDKNYEMSSRPKRRD